MTPNWSCRDTTERTSCCTRCSTTRSRSAIRRRWPSTRRYTNSLKSKQTYEEANKSFWFLQAVEKRLQLLEEHGYVQAYETNFGNWLTEKKMKGLGNPRLSTADVGCADITFSKSWFMVHTAYRIQGTCVGSNELCWVSSGLHSSHSLARSTLVHMICCVQDMNTFMLIRLLIVSNFKVAHNLW